MASEQAVREDTAMVEKQQNPNPNAGTHFQSLLDKSHSKPQTQTDTKSPQKTSPGRSTGTEIDGDQFTYEKLAEDEEGKDSVLPSSTAQGGSTVQDNSTVQGKAKEMGTTALEKAAETKDAVATKGQSTAQFLAEKAKSAAVTAKGVAVEVKDQAVVAGWGTAHYTLEKVAEVSKAAAGYTAEKAEAATKDKTTGAGTDGNVGEKNNVGTEEKDAGTVAAEMTGDNSGNAKPNEGMGATARMADTEEVKEGAKA